MDAPAGVTGEHLSRRPPWEPAAPAGRPVPGPPVPPPPPSAPAGGPQPAAAPRQAGPPAAAPRRRGRWWSALPYLLVLAGVGTGLWWIWQGAQRARGGTFAVAGALFVAALARLVLPEAWAGMLASRKRFTDVVTLVALASGLLAAGLLLPTSP